MQEQVTIRSTAGDRLPAVKKTERIPRFSRRQQQHILAISSLIIFLTVWELLPRSGIVKPMFTSSPSRIVAAGRWLFANGLAYDIYISLSEFVLGFGLAMLIGIPLGILVGWDWRLSAIIEPYIAALYAVPRIALMPLIILWLGIGMESKVAVVFLGAIFPITINVMTGMRTVDETLLRCARAFGASDRQILTTLALPTTVPFMIAGMRLGVGRGLVGVVVGEFIASQAGIGHMMSVAGATFQTDKVFVGVILLAAFGLTLTEVLKRIERHFESWRPTDQR